MSGFTGTLQRDGPARLNGALEGLEADPLRLDHARRISHSPSPYTWNPSGTPTRSASPELSNEQRRKELRDLQFQQRRQLFDERAASLPLNQFLVQVEEEKKRIWYADPRTNWMGKISIRGTEEIKAIEIIKKRWVEQGIWKDKWDTMAAGRYMDIGLWKHEELLELEPESETDTEAEPLPSSFDIFGIPHKYLKIKRPKSDEERTRIAERQVVREREREASRPYYQFVYQVSKERERIQDESADKESADAPDINTKAYENVKNTWAERGIWITKWGTLPGMLWKHEESLEEAINNLAPIPASLFVNSSHDAGEAPTRPIFASLFPVSPNDHQISGIVNRPQQGPSADVDSARLENGDIKRSPSASNLPRPRKGKRVLTGQALRPSRKQSQTVSMPPRRSKRLRALGPSIANGPTGVTSTNSLKSIAGPRPKRNGVGNLKSVGSAKPQGISKKPRTSRTREKARRDDN